MDVENLNSWVSQPDVCRCCLSASGTWDLTASYVTEAGIKEVFSDILQECYGISLSCLTDWGPSRLVCTLCVGHLRDATSFKKQVQEAEKHFTEYISKKDCIEMAIKTELDLDGHNADDFTKHMEVPSTDSAPKNGMKSKSKQDKSTSRKRHKYARAKEKKRTENSDCDSDTPLTFLSKKNVILDTDLDGDTENVDLGCEANDNVRDIPNVGLQPAKIYATKQISERRRVILTCGAILHYTTACPFRHHKSWFQCFFCRENFMQLNTLRNHTNETHGNMEAELKKIKRYPRSLQIDISYLECRHCGVSLTDVESMRRHLGDVHNQVIYRECIADYKVDASPYTCHLCKQEFHVFRTLTTHLNEHYANCICDVCGKSFLNSKRLKVHKRTHDTGQFPCAECGKILKTKTSIANHMESAHSKRIIKCQICFKPMKHYNDRIKHMSEAHNITHKFNCPICSREYNIKHYLATHIRQTHGNKNKKCSECGMAFITNHGLKKHMLKHTGEKPYTCSVCCKAYARSYTLREHMRAHENDRRFMCPEYASKTSWKTPRVTPESYTENRHLRSNITLVLANSTVLPFKHINKYKYTCLYCDNSYLFFNQLKIHINEKHANVTEKEISRRLKTPKNLIKAEVSDIRCKICNFTLKTIDNLLEHLVKNHNKIYYNTPKFKPSHGILGFDLTSEKFRCYICKKEFRFFKNLSVHMNEHSANFVCHYCGKKFLSDHRLHAHVKMHKENDLKCKICDKQFRSPSARAYHVRKEHNKAVYKCPECDEFFLHYQKRIQHLVDVHNLKKPEYKCDICNKKYASSGGLSAHVQYTHLKNREYPCQICGKNFGYKWTLKKHLVVHSGAKNFECKYCSKRFAEPYTLKVHMRIHLNEKPHSCTMCKAAFIQKCSLKNHVRVHHTDDLELKKN